MIRIEIEDKKLKDALESLAQKAVDRRPLMRNIAGIMHTSVQANFEAEGRPKWPPLSPKTIRARLRKSYWPGQILKQRGKLAASISTYSDNDQAVVGTNVKYAAIHQFGGKAGRGKNATIPARPFLQLADRDMETIKKAVIRHLNEG